MFGLRGLRLMPAMRNTRANAPESSVPQIWHCAASAGGLAGGLISADVGLQRKRPRVVRRAVAGAPPAVLEQESRDFLQRRHRRNRDDHPDQAEGVTADKKRSDQQNRMKVNAPADGN